MGARGPIPKRDAERRRRNKPERPTDTLVAVGRVKPPPCPRGLGSEGRRYYRAALASPMVDYWQTTDYQRLRLLAIAWDRLLSSSRISAHLLATIFQGETALGLTEGDRRRMRIEIERSPDVAPADVTEMDEYRRARQG